jgi:hypothetical protein
METPEWHDLDDQADFGFCCASLQDRDTRSFAVRFNTSEAHCAIDLSLQDVESLLQVADEDAHPRQTRWINFWADESQGDAIRAIAKRYGISPRLTDLLCMRGVSPAKSPPLEAASPRSPRHRRAHEKQAQVVDIEKASCDSSLSPQPAVRESKIPGFGDVIDNLWHFCSVDRGRQYLYVGFNALFTMPGVKQDSDSNKPAGIRIWTSLLFCHDGTVVSIFERPPSTTPPEYDSIMRYNVLNIFRHLSKLLSSSSVDQLMQVNVRSFSSLDQASTTDAESPSLLFYYLFDDWMTTYSLITRRNHPYRNRLELIRQEMFETADVNLIKSLHLVGRQLTVLKLMYQSYELIINRILGHFNMNDPLLRTTISRLDSSGFLGTDSDFATQDSGIPLALFPSQDIHSNTGQGIALPPSAIARFERLMDRVRLYALTEIEECLKEKESLVFMVSYHLSVASLKWRKLMTVFTEFQSRLSQRISSCREADTYNYPTRKGNHPLLTS